MLVMDPLHVTATVAVVPVGTSATSITPLMAPSLANKYCVAVTPPIVAEETVLPADPVAVTTATTNLSDAAVPMGTLVME
jgi:hypothetical protein